VSGIREDAWARANRITVEQKKAGKELGKYLHPEAHGVSPKRGLYHAVGEDARKQLASKPKGRAKPVKGRGSSVSGER
jgi:hypothetical protein